MSELELVKQYHDTKALIKELEKQCDAIKKELESSNSQWLSVSFQKRESLDKAKIKGVFLAYGIEDSVFEGCCKISDVRVVKVKSI